MEISGNTPMPPCLYNTQRNAPVACKQRLGLRVYQQSAETKLLVLTKYSPEPCDVTRNQPGISPTPSKLVPFSGKPFGKDRSNFELISPVGARTRQKAPRPSCVWRT
eukprot:TRINITY_DN77469_c0_g1_i1.p1 TRINITY_DN77469_c0_g1~~TRINITY_DN77469_c0_g1_i1.p1  ORF type:complete len:107 (-),score=6.97 TRINITY_DN77469_c0_g1_i1:19-339(-)